MVPHIQHLSLDRQRGLPPLVTYTCRFDKLLYGKNPLSIGFDCKIFLYMVGFNVKFNILYTRVQYCIKKNLNSAPPSDKSQFNWFDLIWFQLIFSFKNNYSHRSFQYGLLKLWWILVFFFFFFERFYYRNNKKKRKKKLVKNQTYISQDNVQQNIATDWKWNL